MMTTSFIYMFLVICCVYCDMVLVCCSHTPARAIGQNEMSLSIRVQKNPVFLKKSPTQWFYWVLWFYWFFWTSRKK